MFFKHRVKLKVATFGKSPPQYSFLLKNSSGCSVEDLQIKKETGVRVEENWFMYIEDWLKTIFPYF